MEPAPERARSKEKGEEDPAVAPARAREADDHDGGDSLSSGEGEPDGFAKACGSCVPISRRQRDEWVAAHRETPEAFSDTRAALEAEEAAGKIGSAEKVLATRVRDGGLRRNGRAPSNVEDDSGYTRDGTAPKPLEIMDHCLGSCGGTFRASELLNGFCGECGGPSDVTALRGVRSCP